MRRSTRLSALLLPVMGAAAALLLTGCFQVGPATGGGGDDDTTATSDTGDSGDTTDTDSGDTGDDGTTVDVFSIGVGDCLLDPGASDTVTDITVIDCASDHNYEVYSSSQVPDGDFPGDDAITSQAESDCDAAFTTFVGLDYDSSALLINYFTPTEGSWADGDREILCLVSDPSGTNAGSLQNANY